MKRNLIVVGFGVGIGYLLGAHAGRERYDQISSAAISLWESPRVAKTRREVREYAREQAPILRQRASDAVAAAPDVAKDVAGRVTGTARDVADRAASTAKDVGERAGAAVKDVGDRAGAAAKDAVEKVTEAAMDAKDQAEKVATELRERGEAAVETAVTTVGEARENALDTFADDEDDLDSAERT